MTRNTMIAALALAGIAAAALPASADAQGLRAGLAHFAFNRADANGDGRIDAAEMRSIREARFAKLDANGDGAISEAELERRVDTMQRRADTAGNLAEGAFAKLDANGDGRVGRDEFVEHRATQVLALVDIDGDGAVSRTEFDRFADAIGALE